MKKHLDVKGMSCSACSAAIERGLNKQNGVNECSVNLLTNSLDIDYNENKIDLNEMHRVVEDLGYELIINNEVKLDYRDEEKSKKQKLITSIVITIILMYVAMGHMFNLPLSDFFMNHPLVFLLTQLILCLPIYLINNNYFKNGFKSLFKLHPNMDTLIALGSSAALVFGLISLVKLIIALNINDHVVVHNIISNLYFETGAMILTLISVGKYLESNSKAKTSEAIRSLMKLKVDYANVIKDGEIVKRKIEDVHVDDLVAIKSGDSIPCDGIIQKGNSYINESMLSGEPIPVFKEINDCVYAATINGNGYLEVKVSKESKDSTISQIINLVEEASNSKAPIARIADKISGIFVPFVLLFSLITFIIWFVLTNNIDLSINFAICVLVVSCPCALGLATPVSIMAATGSAAKNGLLIRNGKVLETISHTQTIFLDKTGTITKGKPIISEYNSNADDFKTIVALIETHSNHPLAKAIINSFNEKSDKEITSSEEISGEGIKAIIDNDEYLVGNLKMMKHYQVNIDMDLYNQYLNKGYSIVLASKNQKQFGIIGISDEIRESSKQAINDLKGMNIKVIMLSGDNRVSANFIGKEANVDKVISEVLPNQKQEYIKQAMNNHQIVMMVGDGINDSPSLATASIGVAISSGSDIALDSADAILMRDNLEDVVSLIKLSKKTIVNIKENLFWALIYNIILMPLAAGVLYNALEIKMSPMLGALCMSVSSIFVVSNALRLRNFKLKESEGILMEKTMMIEGMMCEHCQGRVEKALNEINGVKASVDLANNCAHITCSESVSDELLSETVNKAGYTVKGIK